MSGGKETGYFRDLISHEIFLQFFVVRKSLVQQTPGGKIFLPWFLHLYSLVNGSIKGLGPTPSSEDHTPSPKKG